MRAIQREWGTGTVKQVANGKWTARAPGGKGKHLGTFATVDEATAVLDAWLVENPRPERTTKEGIRTVAKGIGRYLGSLETESVKGNPGVSLGSIGNGLPAFTSNPDDVERAIKITEQRAQAGSAVQRLKRQQRVITLRRELERLRTEVAADDSPREFFIAHALEWATANGVGYSAFRMMGVPVAVLTEAGITRTFEP